MDVDLFTVMVQFANFCILIFILYKILYKPILDTLEGRRKHVEDKINNAETKLQDAEKIKQEIIEQKEQIKQYEIEEKQKINKRLDEYKKEEMEKLNDSFEMEKHNITAMIENEKQKMIEKITKSVCLSAGNFINELLLKITNDDLNNSALNVFLNDIKDMNKDKLMKLQNLDKGQIIQFVSSFDLSQQQQDKVKQVLNDNSIFGEISFEKDEDMIIGNKLIADNITIFSSINDVILQFINRLKDTI